MSINGHIIMLSDIEQNIKLIGLCFFSFSNASVAFIVFCFIFLVLFNDVPEKLSHSLSFYLGMARVTLVINMNISEL